MTKKVVESRARFVVTGYTPEAMGRAGQAVLDDNLRRWDDSQLVDGAPAPPLKLSKRNRYPYIKKAKGGSQKRDLLLTGALRQAMKVLETAANKAIIGPMNGVHPRQAARRAAGKRATTFAGILAINNWRAHMWGVGPKEEQAISAELAKERPIHVEQT